MTAHLRFVVLLCIAIWLCCLAHSACAVSPVYTLTNSTYGPRPVNLTAWQQVNATVYNGTLPSVNFGLPVLKMAGVVTALGSDTTNSALLRQMYKVSSTSRHTLPSLI